jgi:LysR family glycine cleavage system transcriptional activator
MQEDLPPLNGIKSFVEAGRELSFSRAAAILGVTPGAVSRLVRKLEEHLGVRLLERTAHGLRLTAPGEQYFREVATPLSAIAAATRRLERGRAPGRIVVAAYPTFAARWLLPRWNRFFDRHPAIDVQLATSLTDVDFRRDDGVDIAIRLGTGSQLAQAEHDLTRDKLLEIETAPMSSPDLFRDCRDEVQRLQKLAAKVLIHSRPLPGEWRHWAEAYSRSSDDPAIRSVLRRIDVERGPAFETLNLAVQTATEGIGIAVGIVAFMEDDLASGKLALPFAFRRRSRRDFHVVARTGGANARAVKRYVDWLKEEARLSRAAPRSP